MNTNAALERGARILSPSPLSLRSLTVDYILLIAMQNDGG